MRALTTEKLLGVGLLILVLSGNQLLTSLTVSAYPPVFPQPAARPITWQSVAAVLGNLSASTYGTGLRAAPVISLVDNDLTRYSVQLHFVDQNGNSINPGNVTLASVRGLVLVPPSGQVWLANATYSLISANWKGSQLIGIGSYPQLKIAGPLDATIMLPVYDMQVHVQDIFGNPLSGAKVNILLPDGTINMDITGTDGVAQFLQVPEGAVSLSTNYLGVTSQFSVDAAQVQSPSITVALSYPVFALFGVVGGTMAIAFFKLRRRSASAF